MKTHDKVTDLRNEFGATVRQRRIKLKISQEALAEKANIHRTYVSDIELGKVNTGISVAYKLARALNIPLSQLIKTAEKISS